MFRPTVSLKPKIGMIMEVYKETKSPTLSPINCCGLPAQLSNPLYPLQPFSLCCEEIQSRRSPDAAASAVRVRLMPSCLIAGTVTNGRAGLRRVTPWPGRSSRGLQPCARAAPSRVETAGPVAAYCRRAPSAVQPHSTRPEARCSVSHF